MNIQLMDVKRQHEKYASEYEEAALNVLRSGRYIGGEEVTSFENEFASWLGAKHAVSCANGTEAIVMALRALGIGSGDEVITVSWTFFATSEGILTVGARPVLVDVYPDTYCINVEAAEAAITEKTKAILAVHFYGNCCDMEKLRAVCKKHNLWLITDCAQSTGTTYKGERSETLGDIACFSFFPTKILGCDGDGGAIVTDNEDIATACRALKAHGSGKDGLSTIKKRFAQKGEEIPADYPQGESKYYNYVVGYNSRLDAIQAAILRKKLTHLDEFVLGRRANAAYYNEALKDTEYITPFEEKNTEHAYYIYALKHPKAAEIMDVLKANGIACGTYYPVPLHLQVPFLAIGYKAGDFPVTEELAKTSFAIPVFPELTEEEREFIVATLKSAI